MAEENTVTLNLTLNADDLEKALGKAQKKTEETVGGMEKAFGALKFAAAAAVAVFAGKEVLDFFSDGIAAASAQEKAMNSLGKQLQLTGEYSDEALQDFANLADELERTTGIGDDVILNQAKIAKSFGLTNDQTKDLVKSATDLAAATGGTLDGAVNDLIKSYSGQSKALERLDPRIKSMTKEQLAAGDAVRLLGKRFEGVAANDLNNFDGSILKTTNSLGNLQEAVGKPIVESKALQVVILSVGEAFSYLEDIVTANEDAITSFIRNGLVAMAATLSATTSGVRFLVSGLQGAVNAIGILSTGVIDAIRVFNPFVKILDAFGVGASEKLDAAAQAVADFTQETSAGFDSVNDKLGTFGDAVDEVGVKIAAADNATVKSAKAAASARDAYTRTFEKSAKDIAKSQEDLIKLEKEISLVAATEIDKVNLKHQEQVEKIQEFLNQRVINEQQAQRLLTQAAQNTITQVQKLQKDADQKALDDAKKAAEERRAEIEKIASNPITFFVSKLEIDKKALEKFSGTVAAGLGGLNAVLGGRDGAQKLLSSGAGAAADAFFPGSGQAVSQAFDALSQGPEAVKAQVRAFVEAVPEIIEAVADSIPVVVEAFVDAMINDGGAIRIGVAIIRAMSGEAILKSIGKQLGLDFGTALNADGIAKTLSGAGDAIGSKIGASFEKLVGGLNNFLNPLTKGIGDTFERIFKNIGNSLGIQVADAFNPSVIQAKVSEGLLKIYEFLGNFTSTIASTIGTAITASLNTIFLNFPTKVTDALQAAGDKLIANLMSSLSGLFNFEFPDFTWPSIPTPGWVQGLINALNSITGGGGGGLFGIKTGGDWSKGQFFADGGIIPPGFPNDSFMARVSSGEEVVTAADRTRLLEKVENIASRIDGMRTSSAAPTQVVLRIGEAELARVMLNLNRSGFRTA